MKLLPLVAVLWSFAALPLSATTIRTWTREGGREKPVARRTEFRVNTTAVVLIDFWNVRPNDPYFQRAAELVHLARRHGMLVVHLPHGRDTAPPGIDERILPLPSNEIVLLWEKLEEQLAEKAPHIDTLLYAGYSTVECVLYTRTNSLTPLARRTRGYRSILVQDATTAPYWYYLFALHVIQSKFSTTTVSELARALGEPDRYPEQEPPTDRQDVTRSRTDRLEHPVDRHTAVVLLNAWRDVGARVRQNRREDVLPLLAFARAAGARVIHVPNGRPIDPAVRRRGEPVIRSLEELKKFVADNEITTLLYAGNLVSTTELFSMGDPWGFTRELPMKVETRLLEDCLVAEESPETVELELFKTIFLERAVYHAGPQHSVTTAELLE